MPATAGRPGFSFGPRALRSALGRVTLIRVFDPAEEREFWLTAARWKVFESLVPIAAGGPRQFEPNDDGRQREWATIQVLFDQMDAGVAAAVKRPRKKGTLG